MLDDVPPQLVTDQVLIPLGPAQQVLQSIQVAVSRCSTKTDGLPGFWPKPGCAYLVLYDSRSEAKTWELDPAALYTDDRPGQLSSTTCPEWRGPPWELRDRTQSSGRPASDTRR